jgi:hypothetical protein
MKVEESLVGCKIMDEIAATASRESEFQMIESEAQKQVMKQQAEENQRDSALDENRREAMKKLGKYAAYTAPAMMALLLPRKSLAQTRPGL